MKSSLIRSLGTGFVLIISLVFISFGLHHREEMDRDDHPG